MSDLGNEIRSKRPQLAARATRGACSAIRLFCLECVGGIAAEVRDCTANECPLYGFRFGRRPGKVQDPRVSGVPGTATGRNGG